ncbi:NADP-dependent phosphogluconate dehydrogenase [Siculibacillus lacustris]|uniref:6-phosphogluconate dehydrogenase, decarboxylating n=2 Tax=Siculibacillus lacustris TaxID=1549641 RepID=A0A4Q9VX35_9HYPH|nr:NADP-dependent phosphogluconate dehydrogenase [Siculibacillus lacustris]
MGAALALNIAEKGFPIAVFNRSPGRTRTFFAEAGDLAPRVVPCETLEAFVAAIAAPRIVIVMVTAGTPVDDQIAVLRPLLGPDDLLIDCGNADFHDTERRSAAAASGGPAFMGVGVSGGEEGARHGPSIMAGGTEAAWAKVAPVFTAIAAKYEGEPCAAQMGPGGAGHFVKTVHNGIEYADMEMIAEVYGVMRQGLGLDPAAIAAVFERWNRGPLASYLIEISAIVAATLDPETGRPLLDVIVDSAGQKGTGRWTVIEAQMLGAPVTAVEAAVAARNLSARREERRLGAEIFGTPAGNPPDVTVEALENALLAGKILCYAQGFGLLSTAAREFGWTLPLPTIARIWRAGCIIRSTLLGDMAQALAATPGADLTHVAPFTDILRRTEGDLRRVVAAAALAGLPVPALAAALAHFDTMRRVRGTADLIQGQRDFFGAHGFERVDHPGAHHGPWTRS